MTDEEFAADLAQANAEVAQALFEDENAKVLFDTGMDPIRFDPKIEFVVQFTSNGRNRGYVVVPMGLTNEETNMLVDSIGLAIVDANTQVRLNERAHAIAEQVNNDPETTDELEKEITLVGPPAPVKDTAMKYKQFTVACEPENSPPFWMNLEQRESGAVKMELPTGRFGGLLEYYIDYDTIMETGFTIESLLRKSIQPAVLADDELEAMLVAIRTAADEDRIRAIGPLRNKPLGPPPPGGPPASAEVPPHLNLKKGG